MEGSGRESHQSDAMTINWLLLELTLRKFKFINC